MKRNSSSSQKFPATPKSTPKFNASVKYNPGPGRPVKKVASGAACMGR